MKIKHLSFRLATTTSLLLLVVCAPKVEDPELVRQRAHAENVTIIRDDFGVPHIYGKTDADAVFGLLYAQSEDDFNRVERNYIWATGRLAEVEGEEAIHSDLRARLYMTVDEAKAAYDAAPDWLKKLCDAFADGVNYYLHTHPEVEPKLLTRFEPWMPMFFSEGSIGGDIEQIPLDGIRAFYDEETAVEKLASARAREAELLRAVGFERHCDLRETDRIRRRHAAHQPAHVFLLPRRGPRRERGRAECLWRGHVGPVLRIPGIQREHRLDAYLNRGGFHR